MEVFCRNGFIRKQIVTEISGTQYENIVFENIKIIYESGSKVNRQTMWGVMLEP